MASSPTTPHDTAAYLQAAYSQVQAAADALKQQMADFADLEDRIRQNIAKAPTIVALNVSGTTFQAFKDTFLRVEGSYFHALLGSGAWTPDRPGHAYFLDLDPDIFRHVFKFLRVGTLSTDGLTESECCQLRSMMEYLKLGEAPNAVQWDPGMHAPELHLSKGLRTVEAVKANDWDYMGVMAKSPLVGFLRLRVDCFEECFYLGVGPKTDCDVSSYSTKGLSYHLRSNGMLFKKSEEVNPRLPCLKSGDVVTLCRTASCVNFTINDGPTYPIELDDASEELYPIVFMKRSRTKITILDATETP